MLNPNLNLTDNVNKYQHGVKKAFAEACFLQVFVLIFVTIFLWDSCWIAPQPVLGVTRY